MAKRHINLTIDDYIHDRAKEKGLNVSAICEGALRVRLETFNRQILPENCEHDWTFPFCVPAGLMKECKLCGEFKRVYLETNEETMARAA